MKKSKNLLKLVFMVLIVCTPLFGGGIKLQYKLKPSQRWICSLSSKNEFNFMGEKNIDRDKRVFVYKVSKGKKHGWVSLSAHIKSSLKDKESGMDMSRMSFKADMHKSGELRHIKYSGNPMIQGGGDIPPQMKEMMAQQGKMIAEMYKNTVFWFPEFPEETLQIGDEFDVQRSIGSGGGGMQTKTLLRQVFTL